MERVIRGVAIGTVFGVAILAGWGFPKLGAFVDEPARPVALAITILGGCVGGASLRRQQAIRVVSAQTVVAALGGGVILVSPFAVAWLDSHDALPWLQLSVSWFRWLGVLALAAGTALSVASLRSLGPWYSPRIVIQPGHELVQNGPYRYVRHPFYSGFLLAALGFPAAFGLWVGLPFVLATVVTLVPRIDQEEALLASEFGSDFDDMKRRTRKLIPGLY